MKPKPKKTMRILTLALCCGLLFTACRPSTALSREVSSQEDLNIVNDADYFGHEELQEQTEIEYLTGEEVDEDSRNTEQELAAGQVKEDESLEDTADLTPELIYNSLRESWEDLYGAAQVSTDDTNETDSSTVSSSQAGDETASSSTAGGSTDDSANASGGGQGDGSTLNEEQENGSVQDNNVPVNPTDEENENNNDGGDEDEDQNKKIVDKNGDLVTLISGEGKVAAVGEAATLVCMLAGVDRLCATSESQTSDDNPLLQQAFLIDEEECAVLWSGDGGSALSDDDFEILLAIGPDMCFYLSGSGTFSSEQIDRLYEMYEEQGEDPEQHVICLPNFSTQDGIETAVEVVGDALGVQDRAEEYFDWCSDLESDLSGLSAVDTIFIYDWDDTATTTCYGWVASGETYTDDDITLKIQDGAAVIRVGTNWDRPFLEYMEGYANITDRSADPSGEISSSGHGAVWYSNILYSESNGWSALANAASYCTPDGDLCLISSIYMGSQCKTTLDGNYEALKTTRRNIGANGYYSSSYSQAFELLYGLGDDDFPGIIVHNQDTYDSLVSSALWNLDFFDSVGSLTSGAYYYTYGSSDATTDKITSDIKGEYAVNINPAGGIGSWMDGSAESVLESVWAAAKLSGYDETAMYNTIRDFYSTFYGLNLNNSQIDQYVLAGE